MMDTLALLRAGRLAGITRLDLSCGLREFPREIFDLADSLEILNLSQNHLSSLPDDLHRLHRLRILFCSENEFRHVPSSVGQCANLSMVGFKANQIETVDPAAFPPLLRWLILTDNRIAELPASLGRCPQLQKLMLSGNRLSQLPEEMTACTQLEMIRIASNQFRTLPAWLLALPRLSWLAMAGNPCCPASGGGTAGVNSVIPWGNLRLEEKLGEGASGVIYRALWSSTLAEDGTCPVAVKVFKSAVTSDGLASSEIAASLSAGGHPHLIGSLGQITGHPAGMDGLVMSLIDPEYQNLAGPPSLDTCTRDVYAEGQRFTPACVLRLAQGTAAAAAHLHRQHLMHGDLYAHNILWLPDGRCLLGDLGAAFFYDAEDAPVASALQQIEVRAWGCLLEELLMRGEWDAATQPLRDALQAVMHQCLVTDGMARPMFQDLCNELTGLMK